MEKLQKNSKESLAEDDKEQLLNPWMHWWWNSWWLRQGKTSLHRGSLCQWLFWVEKFQKPQAWCYSSSTQTLLTDWGRTAPQVLGQSGCYTEGMMIFIPPDQSIAFFIFIFPFSFKETQCFWAVLMWHSYQCNCYFQRGCQPNYWERSIRKGNVIYSWVIFYNLLLRRWDFGMDRLGMYF